MPAALFCGLNIERKGQRRAEGGVPAEADLRPICAWRSAFSEADLPVRMSGGDAHCRHGQDGGNWRVDGHKLWCTGAGGQGHAAPSERLSEDRYLGSPHSKGMFRSS